MVPEKNSMPAVLPLLAVLVGLSAWPRGEAAELDALVLSEGWAFRPAAERDDLAIADAPAALAIASAKSEAGWAAIAVSEDWFQQGFNPSRAGWYRRSVELPEGWQNKALALRLTSRSRSEIVYVNGVPVGARRKAKYGDESVYLIPGSLTGGRSCTIAIRLDAPGVRRPGFTAPPIMRRAAARELMTPLRNERGALLHRPEGLDFFPNDPVGVGDLLVNVSSDRYGCAYIFGENDARVKVVIANTERGEDRTAAVTLHTIFTIIDVFADDEVAGGGYILDVPAGGAEKVIELYAAHPGSFSARFLFSVRGVTRALNVHYSVFPRPSARAGSPLGLILSSRPDITALSGAQWIMRPGLLTGTFTWNAAETVTEQAMKRMLSNATTGRYRVVSALALPPHVREIDSPAPDAPDALEHLKASYLAEKASKRVVLQLTIPPERREAYKKLLGQGGANYCDVLCVGWELPPDVEPEVFVPEKIRELRSIAAECEVPPAPAIWLAASERPEPERVIRSFLIALSEGASRVYWDANGKGKSGWIRPDGSPAPQMLAVACLAGVLGEAKYLGKLDIGAPLQALAFHSGVENVVAVWKTGAEASFEFPYARRVVGMMGEPVAEHSAGATDVTISEAPVYLCGVADADLAEIERPDWVLPTFEGLVGRLDKMSEVAPGRAIVVRGGVAPLTYGSNEVAVELENRSPRKIAGVAALKLPPGWAAEPEDLRFELNPLKAAGATAKLLFSVSAPVTSSPGEYVVPVVVTIGESKGTAAELRLHLTTVLGDLSGIQLAELQSSAPSIAVPVENPSLGHVRARLGLSITEWTITPRFMPVSLGPGEQKLLRFMVSGKLPAAGPLEVAVTVQQKESIFTLRRTADVSQQRTRGLAIGKPEVQALRFDGRKLSYKLPKMAVVSVRIYDLQGRLVRTLGSGWQRAGPHEYTWLPEAKLDEFGLRISYQAEVRAGLDVVLDRIIGAPEDTVFAPQSVAVDTEGTVHVFEGPRAMKFAPGGRFSGCDLPAAGLAGEVPARALKPLPDGRYAALRHNQLLLLDANGTVLKSAPANPREDGDTAPGHFRDAASIAVSKDGLIYVAETGNHRVQRFDSQLGISRFPQREGNCIGRTNSFGSPVAGTDNGEFTSPSHIAVSHQGRVAVFDATSRLQLFDAGGRLVRTIATGLKEIACMAIDADAVFIVREGTAQVSKFNIAAGRLDPVAGFGADGSVTAGNSSILAIDTNGRGKLFVCGSGAVFVVDASSGELQGALGRRPPADAIASPAAIDVDNKGSIYITDLATRGVFRLSADGELLWTTTGLRTSASLYSPMDVAIAPSGRVYVLDKSSLGTGLAALGLNGRPKFVFGGSYLLESEALQKATTIEVTSHGSLWAGSGERGTLFDSDGRIFVRNALRPYTKTQAGGLIFQPWQDDAGRGVIVNDADGREIARKGGLGTGHGKFAGCMPGGIAARLGGPGKPDYVYYADTFNHRIIMLRIEWNSIAQAAGTW